MSFKQYDFKIFNCEIDFKISKNDIIKSLRQDTLFVVGEFRSIDSSLVYQEMFRVKLKKNIIRFLILV